MLGPDIENMILVQSKLIDGETVFTPENGLARTWAYLLRQETFTAEQLKLITKIGGKVAVHIPEQHLADLVRL